jgi:hypothetical protein
VCRRAPEDGVHTAGGPMARRASVGAVGDARPTCDQPP